jgi:hypothetical protein
MTTQDITAWSVPAFSDSPILPTTLPGRTLDLYAQACRGTTATASFCLRSTRTCAVEVRVEPSCPECQPQVDLRYVKCWWQNRTTVYGKKDPGLVPELLMHNPALIDVRPDGTNVPAEPLVDAETLRPIVLQANVTQQYFVTITVAPGCRPGYYSLRLHVVRNGQPCMALPLAVEVLPFALAPSPLSYAVYHRAAVHFVGPIPPAMPIPRYEAELRNMVAHGFTRTLCYEDIYSAFDSDAGIAKFAEVLAIRKRCGIIDDPFYAVVSGLPWYTPETLDKLREKTTKMRSFFDQQGINDFYLYAKDDSTAATLAAQLPYWQVVHECYGKVMAACGPTLPAEALALVGGRLDLWLYNNHHEQADPTLWHVDGSKAWLYGPSSPEKPVEWYRRRYGEAARRRGWDGCCVYAYRDAAGSPSDDLDSPWKDAMLVYPTTSGVLDTVHWEACREAVLDVRYAKTLVDAGGEVPDASGDLDKWRAETIASTLVRV